MESTRVVVDPSLQVQRGAPAHDTFMPHVPRVAVGVVRAQQLKAMDLLAPALISRLLAAPLERAVHVLCARRRAGPRGERERRERALLYGALRGGPAGRGRCWRARRAREPRSQCSRLSPR